MFRKTQKRLAISAFGAAYVLWGLNTIFIKISVTQLPVEFYVFLRFALASLLLLPFLKGKFKKIKPSLWPRIIIGTVLGFAVEMIVFAEALKRTSALDAALIFLLAPAVMYILSIEVLKERFNSKILLGLVVAFCGGLLIVAGPALGKTTENNGVTIVGNLLAFTAVIIGTAGTIIIKPVLKKVSPVQITSLRFMIGAIVMAPLALGKHTQIAAVHWTPELISAVSYGVLVASAFAYSIYHFGLSRISGEESSVLQYLDPLAGIMGAIIIMRDQLTPMILLGGGLTVLGVYLSEVKVKHGIWHLRSHK